MSDLAMLVRSCIVMTGNDAASKADISKNIKKLKEHNPEFPNGVDKAIWKLVKEFHTKNGHAPTNVAIRAIAKNNNDDTILDRLSYLGSNGRDALIRGDFASVLMAAETEARVGLVSEALKCSADILVKGREVTLDGRKVHLRGPDGAIRYLTERFESDAVGVKANSKDKDALMLDYTYIVDEGSVRSRENPDKTYKLCHLKEGTPAQRWWVVKAKDTRKVKNRTVFNPSGRKCKDDEYNLFDPKQLLKPCKPEDDDPKLFMLYMNLIQNLADGNSDDAIYISRWLSWVVQNIGSPAGSCCSLVLHGAQGSGKGLLGRLISQIFGRYATTVGQSHIEGDFNAWYEGKLFVVANEVTSSYYREKKVVANKIKNLVMDTSIMINRKFTTEYEIDNYSRWLFTSNDQTPVVLDSDDRRFSVCYCTQSLNERHPGVGEKIHKALLDPDKKFARVVLYNLMQEDVSKFDVITPWENEARKTLVRNSGSYYDLWVSEGLPPAGKYSTEEIYQEFTSWFHQAVGADEKVPNKMVFSKHIPRSWDRPRTGTTRYVIVPDKGQGSAKSLKLVDNEIDELLD